MVSGVACPFVAWMDIQITPGQRNNNPAHVLLTADVRLATIMLTEVSASTPMDRKQERGEAYEEE